MAPAAASNASVRLVLPHPACPTSAIVRIRLMECATGLPPQGGVSRDPCGFSIAILEHARRPLAPGKSPLETKGPPWRAFSSGSAGLGAVRLRRRRRALLRRVVGTTAARALRDGDRATDRDGAYQQPLGLDGGEQAAVKVHDARVEHPRVQGEHLVF